tara:strand:- start:1958 stop:2344 length:387 start_codon:yes stop_codon:yes gene_type:complete
MQKIISTTVIVLSIFLNFSAQAFFDPVYRCEISGTYRTFDIGEMDEVKGKSTRSEIYFVEKTKSDYKLLEVVYTSKYISYNLNWTINRKSLVVDVWISAEADDRHSKGTQVRAALTKTGSATGICKKM